MRKYLFLTLALALNFTLLAADHNNEVATPNQSDKVVAPKPEPKKPSGKSANKPEPKEVSDEVTSEPESNNASAEEEGFQKKLDRFHTLTVSSREGTNLWKLKESCKQNGIDLTVLGIGKVYPSNGMKFSHVANYIKSLPEDDILLFVDAFDVLVVAPKATILKKFLSMNVDLLMGAEKNCTVPSCKDKFPENKSPFCYINTGTYMGYVGAIKAWLASLNASKLRDDQMQAIEHYCSHPENQQFFTLDYNCELFYPLYMVEEVEASVDPSKGLVHNLTTGTTPYIIHANGASFKIWNKVYSKLVAPYINK